MAKNKFIGKWRIMEMGNWDKEYFDMEVSAYIKVGENLMGDFQFGLVSGQIDGKILREKGEESFDFTFDGTDGDGWIILKDDGNAEGNIQFHLRDSSTFKAKRIKK